jgi:hypothetical protein
LSILDSLSNGTAVIVHVVHKITSLRVIGFCRVDENEKYSDVQTKIEDLISNELMAALKV